LITPPPTVPRPAMAILSGSPIAADYFAGARSAGA
jgi:hypothetical protein